MEYTCYRLRSLGSRCWGWVGRAESSLGNNIYERTGGEAGQGKGRHQTMIQNQQFFAGGIWSWEQRRSIRAVPHWDLCHPLAQSLAMAHHEMTIFLAITLLLHWLKGCPGKNVASPEKPQRTLKVLKAMDVLCSWSVSSFLKHLHVCSAWIPFCKLVAVAVPPGVRWASLPEDKLRRGRWRGPTITLITAVCLRATTGT